ncbi:MAG: hypothetical protein HOI80_00995 [Alphaproteobacteria bacterium]|jgi:uncharacterized membrane protein|nr:hypothetical protein [Alphaproteobacteria bacterium]MBT5390664.1 hypothetical protein [Alphaproteobacteria bacterium]MBT5541182.1 hypothetical protein [Alphaproteobacteria bacterium]MBT5654064.1 hypothetical protein [Alphaproteobacteria bacterium]
MAPLNKVANASSKTEALSTTERRVLFFTYFLYLMGDTLLPVTGIIIGAIVNYVKQKTGSKISRSHHEWLFRTFIITIGGLALSLLFWSLDFHLGAIIATAIIYFWSLYREIRGFLNLLEGKPAPHEG